MCNNVYSTYILQYICSIHRIQQSSGDQHFLSPGHLNSPTCCLDTLTTKIAGYLCWCSDLIRTRAWV